MFKWFMTKTLMTKIIIATSSVVVIGGATIGAIIVPKVIETKQEEQRQEQLRIEKEEDLANIAIELKTDRISIPYKGVTQGITIERYTNLDEAMPYEEGEVLDKEKLTEVLKELFIQSYTGGELKVDFDENINGYTKRGDYPITFTVTSEKGNTKSETATITVSNFYNAGIYLDKKDITITKGTAVNIMEGVKVDSILPKEEQGEIKTEGTVDTNTVGTYTIKYTYIPKEGLEGVAIGSDNVIKTYKVVEKTNVKLNTTYTSADELTEGIRVKIVFTSTNTFDYKAFWYRNNNADAGTYTGTYTSKGNKIVLNGTTFGKKYIIINNSDNTFIFDPEFHEPC